MTCHLIFVYSISRLGGRNRRLTSLHFIIESLIYRDFFTLPIILSVCIFLVAYLFVPKIKGCVKRDYILFGVMWFVLTNLFDLSSYIRSGEGFAGLLQSYNILTGNTWILVVLSALISPMLVMKIKEKK